MPQTKRKKRARVEWEQRMGRYEVSNLSQREFCAQHGLAYSSFCYWRRQLRTAASVETEAPAWIELSTEPSNETPDWRIELDLGHGVVLRVR